MFRKALSSAALCLLCVSSSAYAQRTTTAGDFAVELPTLVSLGFDWQIAGDDNRNASVEVTYRKKGTAEWERACSKLAGRCRATERASSR